MMYIDNIAHAFEKRRKRNINCGRSVYRNSSEQST